MTLTEFKSTLNLSAPPAQLHKVLQALWYDAKGDWNNAHNVAQDVDSEEGSWVHAYLHRKEGDLFNASYWYNRAGRRKSSLPPEGEWEEIVTELLKIRFDNAME